MSYSENISDKLVKRGELKKYLPHREPMLLVDEIDIEENGICHARYRIKEDEFFCQGHFPDSPIVPGVILCEIMAQSCALLVKDEIVGKIPLYTGIDNVRFRQTVKPGDLCEVTARLKNKRGPLFFCQAALYVDGGLCCKGDLTFALL